MSTRPRQLLVIGAILLAGTAAARAQLFQPPPETPAVRLHPKLPEVLDHGWIERLQLFPEVIDLQRVRFGQSPWGAVVARLEVEDPDLGPRVIVRSLAGETWRQLQQRTALIMAGQPLPPVAADAAVPPRDHIADARAWPETPPPPTAPARDPLASMPGRGVPVRGQWLALVEAGVRGNVSEYNAVYTPMGQIGLAFAYGASDRFLPSLGFQAGFGDMRGDFEDAFGDGRTNSFGFTLSALLRQPLGQRHALYLEGGGGYFVRSLFWGGAFTNPATGEVTEGRVIEQTDLGWTARVGWLITRPHPRRPRFLDIGVGVQSSTAEPWAFSTDQVDVAATGRDTWVFLTVRFWDGL